MSTKLMIYQPKGGMCMTCKHNERDCSALTFHNMPVIGTFLDVQIVRCTEYVKL